MLSDAFRCFSCFNWFDVFDGFDLSRVFHLPDCRFNFLKCLQCLSFPDAVVFLFSPLVFDMFDAFEAFRLVMFLICFRCAFDGCSMCLDVSILFDVFRCWSMFFMCSMCFASRKLPKFTLFFDVFFAC